MSLNSRLT